MIKSAQLFVVVVIGILATSQSFAQKNQAETIDSSCQAKIDNLKKQGLSEANLSSASIYQQNLGKDANQRYVVFAELGDDRVSDGVYKGWLKVLDRETGRVDAYPMTGPSNRDPLGAYLLSGKSTNLVPKSPTLKNSKLALDVCEKKESTICISPESKQKLQALLEGASPLLLTLPGTNNSKTTWFDADNVNAAGEKRAEAQLTKLRTMYSPNLCDALLAGVPEKRVGPGFRPALPRPKEGIR